MNSTTLLFSYMKKINKDILNHLKLSGKIFKYPVTKGTIENMFDPNIDKDFEQYMVIKRDNGEVRLSKDIMFTHENTETTLIINDVDLLDGTWWVLP